MSILSRFADWLLPDIPEAPITVSETVVTRPDVRENSHHFAKITVREPFYVRRDDDD